MNISNSPSVQSASTAAQTPASVLVLKKALDQQSTNAAQLLQALPQMPQLATSGTLGRNVNTTA